ncbi:MAG TPA: asparagine synthase (glutamine-hydrolyzing) [Candidatus Sulfotelmatobacter sp.]|jgi:asparagine synthase (glutamine-hydrolysing)|nr:asparagine synthase (glutamine-hydrolyzing) [Candidatus Sulfotelmatobacter sp.]
MCGIAGIVNTAAGQRIEAATIHCMCQAIVHRGPDDEGIFVKDRTGFGMRRLSIIDLAGGHQPVFNEDRSVWVVFNGEIYNFQQIRSDLQDRGHHLSTHSDTEVIVHLYEEMGRDCVHQLRGMFAFALYDERRRKVLIARDRLGEKPLHYAFDGQRLLFGSEIKSILAVAPELARVDRRALRQYVQFGYIPDPATAFLDIKKLPPGYLLELQDGKLSVSQYWDLPDYGTHSPASEEECLEQLEQRLGEAVKMRLIADVPLGAFLSGGADSSTIVALMARFSSGPVKTFSIGFRQKDFDETSYARLVAQKFGTEHHELVLEPDVVNSVETLTHSLEEPFGDASALPTYYVSCLARQHVTVALSGDAGDEIFAGYDRYRVCLQDRAFPWIPAGMRRIYREYLHPIVPRQTPGRSLSYSIALPWQERYLEDISLQPLQRQLQIFSDDFITPAAGEDDPFDVFRDYLDRAPAKDPLSRLLYLDSKTYLPADILTKVDRMSMLTSLEARAPMVDHVFVEWATGLTAKWKMRGGDQKYIFRKLAERLGVPRETLYRPKQGFALPLVHWTRHELKDLILTVLLDPRSLQRGYVNARAVRLMLDEHFRERRNHAGRIWRLLMLEMWHRNYLEKHDAESVGAPESAIPVSGDAL